MPVLDDVGVSLLTAASNVLAAEGASALTVRRIAAEAGVSTMNVYSRFGGKDGVVDQLYAEGFRRLTAEMESAGLTDNPRDDLRRCGRAYRSFAFNNPTLYSVMFAGVIPDFVPTDESLITAIGALQHLADRVEACTAAGVLAPIDPLHGAGVVWAACHGVMSLELNHAGPPGLDWSEIYEQISDAVLRGLES